MSEIEFWQIPVSTRTNGKIEYTAALAAVLKINDEYIVVIQNPYNGKYFEYDRWPNFELAKKDADSIIAEQAKTEINAFLSYAYFS